MSSKERVTVTLDPDLIELANEAVRRGRASSVSAYVNEALRAFKPHDQRRAALDEVIGVYERVHGPITQEEIDEAMGHYAKSAIVVKPPRRRKGAA